MLVLDINLFSIVKVNDFALWSDCSLISIKSCFFSAVIPRFFFRVMLSNSFSKDSMRFESSTMVESSNASNAF